MLDGYKPYFDINGWENAVLPDNMVYGTIYSMKCTNLMCSLRWEHEQLFRECPICGSSILTAKYKALKEQTDG